VHPKQTWHDAFSFSLKILKTSKIKAINKRKTTDSPPYSLSLSPSSNHVAAAANASVHFLSGGGPNRKCIAIASDDPGKFNRAA